jgi:hypothetical protein
MNFKTDTKEKFSVITLVDPVIPANMTVELQDLLQSFAGMPVPHLVVKMGAVNEIAPEIAFCIANAQQSAYEKDASFVICEITAGVEKVFEDLELMDTLNQTPSESEAWDIVQMEEIERELMNDFGDESTEA